MPRPPATTMPLLAFDHEKLMMVTRLFAREHGLRLPEGYEKGRDGRGRQLSLYEKHQQDTTGITKEERMALVTAAWRASDSPRAFIRALEQQGYILATGNRPYVLVDRYGHTNALPKLIDDRGVRTRDIRAFLAAEFPPDSLPSVDEAKALAAQHRRAAQEFGKEQARAERMAALEKAQATRRARLEGERAALPARQRGDRRALLERQHAQRAAHRAAYLVAARQARIERSRRRPRGLAAFLGRVSGVALVIRKLEKRRDRRRYEAFRERKDRLVFDQKAAALALQRRQEMQALDMARKLRALEQIDRRERSSLETALQKERRVRARAGDTRMPALALELRPPGRPAAPHKAKNRHISPLARELAAAGRQPAKAAPREIDLADEFARAAGGRKGGEGGGDSSRGPDREPPIRRARRRKRERDNDRER